MNIVKKEQIPFHVWFHRFQNIQIPTHSDVITTTTTTSNEMGTVAFGVFFFSFWVVGLGVSEWMMWILDKTPWCDFIQNTAFSRSIDIYDFVIFDLAVGGSGDHWWWALIDREVVSFFEPIIVWAPLTWTGAWLLLLVNQTTPVLFCLRKSDQPLWARVNC